jgi:hypothetical protein
MSIKVIPATAIALTVSFIEPGFTVWADYKVDVSYKEPVYFADWREIAVEAAVSQPDVIAVDVVDPIDQTVLFTTKSLTDAVNPSDADAVDKEVAKSAQDTYGMVDTPAKALDKFLLTTYAGFLDQTRITQLKTLADSLTTGSAEAKAFSKALKDFQTFSDSLVKSTTKNFTSEVVTLSDATNLTYTIGKQIEDLQTVIEALAVTIEKAPFLEGLNLIDNMDGNIEFGLVKTVGELQLLADQIQNIDTTKLLADAPVVYEELAKSFVKAPFVDATEPVDSLALANSKDFSDSLLAAHTQIVRLVAKVLTDIHGEFTDILVYQLSKNLSDTQGLEEFTAKDFSKTLSVDFVAAQDVYASTLDKLFVDALLPADAPPAISIVKSLSDAVSLADSVLIVKFIIRDFIDTVETADQYIVNLQPENSDVAGVTDEESISFVTSRAEVLNMLDNMDGDLTYAIVKSLATELIAVSEKTVIAPALQKADNVVTGSAGSLLSQDYVEPGYFAEDYVGTSRTFS